MYVLGSKHKGLASIDGLILVAVLTLIASVYLLIKSGKAVDFIVWCSDFVLHFVRTISGS